MNRSSIQSGDKVIKLRQERVRELLGRFLIIQASRSDLVPKLEETIGVNELVAIPRSLFAVDGSLLLPNDKSSLMHAVEHLPADSEITVRSMTSTSPPVDMLKPKVIIIDAMAVFQSMKKVLSMKKICDLEEAYVMRIKRIISGYDEGCVIFDRYLQQSLKEKTRHRRAATSAEYAVHLDMVLTMSLKDLLSTSSTKEKLTSMLAHCL